MRAPNADLQATLERFEEEGVRPVDFEGIRASRLFCSWLAERMVFGPWTGSGSLRAARRVLGANNVWLPVDWWRYGFGEPDEADVEKAMNVELESRRLLELQTALGADNLFLFWCPPKVGGNPVTLQGWKNWTTPANPTSLRSVRTCICDFPGWDTETVEGWHLIQLTPLDGSLGQIAEFQFGLSRNLVGRSVPNAVTIFTALALLSLKSKENRKPKIALRTISRAATDGNSVDVGWHRSVLKEPPTLETMETNPGFRSRDLGLAIELELPLVQGS